MELRLKMCDDSLCSILTIRIP